MKSNLSRVLMLAIAATLAGANAAYASGPGTGGRRIRLDDEPAGPYLVSVVSSPTPPVAEALYLEIRIKDAETNRVMSAGTVLTRAEPMGFEAASVEAEATHDIAPVPIDFASHLPVSLPGNWQITIDIDGPLGSATVSFPLLVTGSAQGSSLPLVPLLIGGILVAGLAIAVRASKRPNTNESPSR
jgi:hypothetical protein